MSDKHHFVANELNDFCAQCERPRYSVAHEDVPALPYGDIKWSRSDVRWIADLTFNGIFRPSK